MKTLKLGWNEINFDSIGDNVEQIKICSPRVKGGRKLPKKYCSKNRAVLSADGSVLIYVPRGVKGEYKIPDGVSVIEQGAFVNCTGIESVVFPASLRVVKKHSFCNSGIRKLNIPVGVVELEAEAFDSCKLLRDISFEDNSHLKSFGKGVFKNCPDITNVNLPENIKYMSNAYLYGSSTLFKSRDMFGESIYDASLINTSKEKPEGIIDAGEVCPEQIIQDSLAMDDIGFYGLKELDKDIKENNNVKKYMGGIQVKSSTYDECFDKCMDDLNERLERAKNAGDFRAVSEAAFSIGMLYEMFGNDNNAYAAYGMSAKCNDNAESRSRMYYICKKHRDISAAKEHREAARRLIKEKKYYSLGNISFKAPRNVWRMAGNTVLLNDTILEDALKEKSTVEKQAADSAEMELKAKPESKPEKNENEGSTENGDKLIALKCKKVPLKLESHLKRAAREAGLYVEISDGSESTLKSAACSPERMNKSVIEIPESVRASRRASGKFDREALIKEAMTSDELLKEMLETKNIAPRCFSCTPRSAKADKIINDFLLTSRNAQVYNNIL